MLKIKIIETGKIETLSVTDPNTGIDWTADFITDGGNQHDDDGNTIMDQDTYNFWSAACDRQQQIDDYRWSLSQDDRNTLDQLIIDAVDGYNDLDDQLNVSMEMIKNHRRENGKMKKVAKINANDQIDGEIIFILVDANFEVSVSNGDDVCLVGNGTAARAFEDVEISWGRWNTFQWLAEYDESTNAINETDSGLIGCKWGQIAADTQSQLLRNASAVDGVVGDNMKIDGPCIIDLMDNLAVSGNVVDGDIIIADDAILYDPIG